MVWLCNLVHTWDTRIAGIGRIIWRIIAKWLCARMEDELPQGKLLMYTITMVQDAISMSAELVQPFLLMDDLNRVLMTKSISIHMQSYC